MIKNEKLKWLNVLFWLASVVAMIALFVLGGELLGEDDVSTLIEYTVISVVMLIFLYLISGKKTFTFLNNQTGYTVKMLLPTLIFSGVFGLSSVVMALVERPPLLPGWPAGLLLEAANMFLVGVYEETCYRACACDALLPVLKKCRHPFLLTALISGILFGYVHVPVFDFSDLQQTLQFVLKIADTAVLGGTFLLLYWKTRNLLGLAIVHGLNDFLPGFMSKVFLFETAAEPETYTSGNVSTTVVYAIQLAIGVVVLIHVYRKVGKTLDYKKILEEW